MKRKLIITLGAIIALYAAISVFFAFHFYRGTIINGQDCQYKTIDETKTILNTYISKYSIQLTERDNQSEDISAASVGLSMIDDGKLENILKEQKCYAWITMLWKKQVYDHAVTIQLDEGQYKTTYEHLNANNKKTIVKPKNAYSKYNKKTDNYQIIPEVYGNTPIQKNFYNGLHSYILNLEKEFDLEKNGCYKNPKYKKDSKEIISSNKKLNKIVNTEISYNFGDRKEILDGKKIHKWLSVNKQYKVSLDENKVREFVTYLADKYDTVGITRNFTSIAGNHISVSGGTYGWTINQEEEYDKLLPMIKKGKQEKKRKPEYSHIAKSRNKVDVGDTYIEIDLAAQHMWCYKNGKTLVSTPVVTGDISKGRGTPEGVYYILYKDTNHTLRGPGYASFVNYWMPYMDRGIGIHDSSWRGSYGGGIFRYNGSHGCVNTPYSAVQTIYYNIDSTYPVVVHW